MDWLAFSLIAATLWGTVSIVDKVILEKYIPNPSIYAFFLGLYGLGSALVVGAAVQVQAPSLETSLPAFFSGLFYLGYILLYFAALSRHDAAVVVALGQISPIFTALWGYFILGEVFKGLAYVGVALVIGGAVLISGESKWSSGQFRFCLNVALPWMVAACLARSLSDLLLKYPLAEMSAWDGFLWPRLGIFAGAMAVLLYNSAYRRLWSAFKGIGWQINFLIMGSEITALIGILAITIAYDRGPLTLVSAAGSIQPLFIMLLVWVVNGVRKDTVPDRMDRRSLIIRLLAFGMIITGVYLINSARP